MILHAHKVLLQQGLHNQLGCHVYACSFYSAVVPFAATGAFSLVNTLVRAGLRYPRSLDTLLSCALPSFTICVWRQRLCTGRSMSTQTLRARLRQLDCCGRPELLAACLQAT
jgi:hypothetical protein